MKYHKLHIKLLAVTAILFALFNSSCNKEDDLGQADRLFRPVINKISYGGNWIRMEWDKYAGVKSYLLQLSTDTFNTISLEVETDTTFYKFEDLEYDTDYFIRIKSTGETLESRYFENEVIHTSDFPTRLNAITSSDVIDTQVKVTWSDVNYDSLVVVSADTIFKTVVLNDAINEAKQVVIKALVPESSYLVKAYRDGEYQGKKSFSTVAPQVFEGDVLDLRGYSDEESYSMLNQTFFNDLATNYPNGVTVVLSGGTKYELKGSLYLKSSLNLITGYTVNGKAIIEVDGNYNLEADTEIENLYFEKLAFTDHPNSPRTKDSNFGSRYVMNISNAGTSIDNLSFEDCDIRYKRGVFRIQQAGIINTISFNNCFIDSIAGYGVVVGDNAAAIIDHVRITNSTIAHAQKIVTATKAAGTMKSFYVDRLTTCFVTSSTGNYLFDLNGQTLPEGLTITKSLFGKPWNVSSTNGLRSSASISLIQDNYRTSDCIWTFNVDANGNPTTEKAPIESTQLSEDSDQIFASPASNDYTVTDSRLKGKIGDPRW